MHSRRRGACVGESYCLSFDSNASATVTAVSRSSKLFSFSRIILADRPPLICVIVIRGASRVGIAISLSRLSLLLTQRCASTERLSWSSVTVLLLIGVLPAQQPRHILYLYKVSYTSIQISSVFWLTAFAVAQCHWGLLVLPVEVSNICGTGSSVLTSWAVSGSD